MSHPALKPGSVGPVRLRNRILKAATFEGMTPEGRVTDDLIEHHAGMAERGVALTTVAYGAVERAGRTFEGQLLIDEEAGLAALADAVHANGGAAALQLTHCGGFTRLARPPKGPSNGWNAYGTTAGRPRIRSMTDTDVARVVDAFARAATIAADAGIDAVEIHCGHGYLLSQFLSPVMNRRTDDYGGSLRNRLRLSIAVIERVAKAVGDRVAVLVKMNLSDGISGGLSEVDAPQIASAFQGAGADAVVTSGGLVQRSAFYLMRGSVPLREMAAAEERLLQKVLLRAFGSALVRSWPWSPGFFIDAGRQVVEAVGIPVVALGGLDSASTLRRAFDAGYVFVAMGRTLLADPDFVERLAAGEEAVSRCDHCNQCVAQMDMGGVRCILP